MSYEAKEYLVVLRTFYRGAEVRQILPNVFQQDSIMIHLLESD